MALPRKELRRRPRVILRWPITLHRNGNGKVVETLTENLSSQGFYCRTSEPFAFGECLDCVLRFPEHSFGGNGTAVRLRCRASVVRVETAGPQHFGIACRIEDYSLQVSAASPAGRPITSN